MKEPLRYYNNDSIPIYLGEAGYRAFIKAIEDYVDKQFDFANKEFDFVNRKIKKNIDNGKITIL